MLRNLLRREKASSRPPAAVPEGTRVYAIGDIHGSAHLLDALRERIAEDAGHGGGHGGPERKVLVYLGDYVDRGLESPRVIDMLIAGPPPGFEQVCLMGNHEEAMFGFLEDISVGPMWLRNGGGETLLSYGVSLPSSGDVAARLEAARHDLRARLPRAHLDFLRGLQLFHVEGDYLFVHAGVRPGVELGDQHRNDMLWIREEFLRSNADLGHMVVHGHTIATEPQVRANRIGIDTGAYATGVLTCLVLEGTERRFLQTGGH